ncbi:hypothetical protein SteCoe_3926 [Stentor coeruleus]|uniref:Nudix hydrolase domain-containing protein n=1 Tax=Stentor coeruleus TaxID=5963 RepID=A0A1R2CVV7_9CILI|nr:hypothetical protein SteCoe_3926 [Stentor coeruleus]
MTKPVLGRNNEVVPWEYVVRQRKTQEVDGVDVIAKIRDKFICVAVYRYPLSKYVLGFPAGLMENLEPAEAALKELKEEAGYTARIEDITYISPQVFIDPWKSTESTIFVMVNVPEIPENEHPEQNLEGEEEIIVELIDKEDFIDKAIKVCEEKGYLLEARLFMFGKGLKDTFNSLR